MILMVAASKGFEGQSTIPQFHFVGKDTASLFIKRITRTFETMISNGLPSQKFICIAFINL